MMIRKMKHLFLPILVALILTGFVFAWGQNLEEIGSISGKYNEVMVVGDFAYCAADSGLRIIDVSNPQNPALIGFVRIWFSGDNGYIDDIFIIDGYAYLTSRNGLYRINVANPFNPVILDSIVTCFPSDVYGNDKYLYLSLYDTTIINIFDVSDSSNIIKVGSFTTNETPSGIYVSGYYMYVVEVGWGLEALYVVNITEPSNPEIAGELREFISPREVYVHENYAYLCFGSPDIMIVDINTPSDPVLVGSLGIGGNDIVISGTYAVAGVNSLKIIDISDPTNPTPIDSVFSVLPRDMYIVDDYIYIVDRGGKLRIFKFNQTSVEEKENCINTPYTFHLSQNYPNPFNSATVIEYQLSKFGFVSLKIYDLLGREIKTLLNNYQDEGYFRVYWDGKDNYNAPVSSGIYYYSLTTNNDRILKRMALLK